MKNYFLLIDFATISCSREDVAKLLTEWGISFYNQNDYVMYLTVPDNFARTPFDTDCNERDIYELFTEYLSYNSFLLVVKADEYYPTANADTTSLFPPLPIEG